MIHPRSNETNRYPLFSQIFDNISDNKILDFGGSSGNLLYFSENEILPENYTCVDVVNEAVVQGASEFTEAEFIHYNKYNCMYNQKGTGNCQFPEINTDQDYIWAYSVFSHTDYEELKETLQWFMSFNYKKIAVSILDIANLDMLQFFYNKRVKEYGTCDDILSFAESDSNVIYFFDNNITQTDVKISKKIDCKHFLTFYNTDWLIQELRKDKIFANLITVDNSYVPFLTIER